MAWNEPGGGKDKDPWGSGNKQDGPPDLDELVKKMQDKFNNFMGGKGKKGNGSMGGGSGGGVSLPGKFGLGLLAFIALVVWGLSGIYIVAPAEQGIVLQFGKYNRTVSSGPHWHIPYPVEQVEKVDVQKIRPVAPYKAQMLTKDQNLIRIDLTVQYQVNDAEKFLFKVRNPELTMQEATESALRDVVGSKDMDELLSKAGGRSELVLETKRELQDILNKYETGMRISKVNLETMQPPKEVRAAFDDAINAEEDEDRYKKQAEAYENDIIPKAEGDAVRLEQEANSYKQQVIDKAKGETSRFLQTLKEYTKAPGITRKRLYLETMESVLSNSSKILIKVKQGNTLMYLPLDKLMRQSEASGARTLDPGELQRALTDSANTRSRRTISRPNVRTREGR